MCANAVLLVAEQLLAAGVRHRQRDFDSETLHREFDFDLAEAHVAARVDHSAINHHRHADRLLLLE
jgi:hypothetical protein